MISIQGKYPASALQNVRTAVQTFGKSLEQRLAQGQITLRELTTGSLRDEVNRILALIGLPRLCGTDTIWKLLYLVDYQIPGGQNLISAPVRNWLLGPLWDELEAQERTVVGGLNGLLVVVHQAVLTQRQAPESPDLATIIEHGQRAREQICAFVRRYPSLLTFGVQTRLMDADDLEIARAFVESFQGTPDFVTQQSIIATQSRLRGRGISEPLRAVTEAGSRAAKLLGEGISAVMETVNNEIRGNFNASLQQGQKIDTQVAALQGEVNNNRALITRLRAIAEQEIERYAPNLYLTLMRESALEPYTGGEIVGAETRIDRGVTALIAGLTAQRDEYQAGHGLLLNSLREIFDHLRDAKNDELRRLETDLQRNRIGWEKDPHREEHYGSEIKRLEAALNTQRSLVEQQAKLRANVENRVEKLMTVQTALLDRLIQQIQLLHERIRAQTRTVFAQLVTVPLASEKQVALVEFGDRNLLLELISNLRSQLSYDTQVLIAATLDEELQRALVKTLGDALVIAARKLINPNLLVAAFDEKTLIAELNF